MSKYQKYVQIFFYNLFWDQQTLIQNWQICLAYIKSVIYVTSPLIGRNISQQNMYGIYWLIRCKWAYMVCVLSSTLKSELKLAW